MMSLYRTILKDAWLVTRRYKFLWFFGLFVAFLGNGGEYELLRNAFERLTERGVLFPSLVNLSALGFFETPFLKQLGQLFFTDTFTFFQISLLFIVALAVLIFFIWLIMISQGALIKAVSKVGSRQKINFKNELAEGRQYFLPIFAINFVLKSLILIVLILVGLPLLFFQLKFPSGTGQLLYFISYLVFVPAAVIFSFVAKYAICYVVLKKEKVLDALIHGWQLFIRHWLISLEMALILLVINLLAGLVLIFLGLIIISPLVLLFITISYLTVNSAWWLFMVLISRLIFILLILFFGAVLATFQWSSWILLFSKLTKGAALSKVVRIFSGISSYALKK